MTDLIPIETVNAVELFSSDKTLLSLLGEIEKEATNFEPDTSTVSGRKEIASQAHKVSRSKVAIEQAGKGLTDDWLQKKRAVDANRKMSREFLDDLRDRIRAPLDEWEAEEAEKVAAAAQKAELEAAHIEALAENDLFDRARKLAEREAAIEAAEEEFRLKEEAEERERQQAELEERLRRAAKERADREAQEKIEKAERLRKQAERATELERIESARREEAARFKAERETEERLRREEGERQRIKTEERAKVEAAARRKTHRNRINKIVCKGLTKHGLDAKMAAHVVATVEMGAIPHLSIDYISEMEKAA